MIIKLNSPANLIEYPEDAPAQINQPKIITVNEFGEYCSSQFSSIFTQLNQCPQDTLFINVDSPGGAISSLFGILSLIEHSPKKVCTFTNSMAASCGAILLSSGTKGLRFASKDSLILVHQASTSVEGKTSEVINDALYVEKLNDKLLNILAKNSNKTKKFYEGLIRKQNNADLFISAQEALSYGLIDHVGIPEVTMNVSISYDVKPSPVASWLKTSKK